MKKIRYFINRNSEQKFLNAMYERGFVFVKKKGRAYHFSILSERQKEPFFYSVLLAKDQNDVFKYIAKDKCSIMQNSANSVYLTSKSFDSVFNCTEDELSYYDFAIDYHMTYAVLFAIASMPLLYSGVTEHSLYYLLGAYPISMAVLHIYTALCYSRKRLPLRKSSGKK